MSSVLIKVLGVLTFIAFAAAFVFTSLAFRYQLTGTLQSIVPVAWVGTGIFLLTLMLLNKSKRRGAAVLTLVLLLGFSVWWARVLPQYDLDWAPELAQTVTGDVGSDEVILSNVRNFLWQNSKEFTERWETKTLDLKALNTVDAILSYWGKEAIAHVLVSFGFSDGQRIVFSAEIRRELEEEFSELGGLFKQFELIIVAATEEDILRLRTNAREPKEDVFVYPIKLTDDGRRKLFLSYVGLANELAERPQWYNTITENCSTTIFQLVRHLNPDTAFDWRFLASGYLPEYFAENNMFVWPKPFGDFRKRASISLKAQAISSEENYSEVIRRENR